MKFRIKVAATSANIGSGFDTIGLALNLYNTFEIETRRDKQIVITGIDKAYATEDNPVITTIREILKRAGIKEEYFPGINMHETSNVPFGVGLGSSATCIAAGVVAGNLIAGEPFDMRDLSTIATQLEGHPDNVVPALFGNLTTSVITDDGVYSIVKCIPEKYRFFACIPNFELPTKESRTALPESYSRAEVVSSLSRATMTFLCLSEGYSEILKQTFGDVLHEPYRKGLIPGYDEIVQAGKDYGALIAYLSGAGPTIMFVVDREQIDTVEFNNNLTDWISRNFPNWQVREFSASRCGVEVKN